MIYVLELNNINEKAVSGLLPLLPPSRRALTEKRQGKEKLATILEYFLVFYALKLDSFIDFSYTKSGKPYIPGHHFSLSHKDDIIVLAVGESEVGVDVEPIHEADMNMAGYILNKREFAKIKKSNNPDEDFTIYWVKKEAALKKLGLPLSEPLKDILNTKLKFKVCKYKKYYIALCK